MGGGGGIYINGGGGGIYNLNSLLLLILILFSSNFSFSFSFSLFDSSVGHINFFGMVNSIKIFVNSISELTMELKFVCN